MTIEQAILNTFAKNVFRAQGDQDYVAARSVYRLQLREQFLWLCLQSLEKYLKAILLFNGRSSRYRDWPVKRRGEFRHDLQALLDAVRAISQLDFCLPKGVESFVLYLDRVGNNRYLDRVSYTLGGELERLDESVWHIRRYCQYLHFRVEEHGQKIDLLEKRVATLKAETTVSKPWKFRLHGGLLEEILGRSQEDPARQALVWQNLFYGSRGRGKVSHPSFEGFVNSPGVWPWGPDASIRAQLEEYVKFT
jgi:hypothetical protein